MAVIKKSSRVNKPAPPGLQQLRCFFIADIGTQKVTFEGNEKEQHQMVLGFELPAVPHFAFDPEKPKEKSPFSVFSTVTASFSDRAKIRKWLESMNGKKYDKKVKELDLQKELLDVPCVGQLVAAGDNNEYTNIVTLLPAVDTKGKTLKVPPLTNKVKVFDYDPENFDKEGFDNLYGWVQEKIKNSKEFSIVLGSGALSEDGGKTKKSPPKKKAAATPAKAAKKKVNA